MIAMTPGVNQISEGGSWFAAFGSDVKSSQWNIDGLDRTAPEGGDLSWSMNDELVEEIQVLGTGATAEYGGMMGTAFNLVTKSGTNEFRGSAAFDYWNPNWVSENARREDAPEGAQTYQLDHHNNLALSLGGPIVKDKLWFFAGAEFGRFQHYWPFQDSDLRSQKESTWDNFDLKLTAQLAQNHRLNVTGSHQEYLGPSAGDVIHEPSAWSENWNHHQMVALDYSAILGQNTVLEARGGIWRGDNEYRSQYPSGEPTFVDSARVSMAILRRCVVDLGLGAALGQRRGDPHPARRRLHQGRPRVPFRRPVQQGRRDDQDLQPPLLLSTDTIITRGYPYVYLWYTGLPYYYGGESESIGAFVTDSWTVSSKLTLDIGVRYDSHKGWVDAFNRLDMDSNPTGEVIPGNDMVDWSTVDPRFGFAWQPNDNGRTVLRGSIGLFHAGVDIRRLVLASARTRRPGAILLASTGMVSGRTLSCGIRRAPDTFIIPGTENA